MSDGRRWTIAKRADGYGIDVAGPTTERVVVIPLSEAVPRSELQPILDGLNELAETAGRIEISSKVPTRDEYEAFINLVYKVGDSARALLSTDGLGGEE